jgi:hypothetical protein
MDIKRFRSDLYELASRACEEDDEEVRKEVLRTADILVGLYSKRLVKINHSALELVCARALVMWGYDVKVEHRLDSTLVCDLMGSRGDGTVIVEIETGFIPPEAALEPSAYARGRISSKIARYSRFGGKFVLGTTPSYLLDFPTFFMKPTRSRTAEEASEVKALTDRFYDSPPISVEEFLGAKLHSVFVIDVEEATVTEKDPESYHAAAEGVFTAGGVDVDGPRPTD